MVLLNMELNTRKQLGVVSCIYLGKLIIGYGLLWFIPMLFKILREQDDFQHVITIPFMVVLISSTFLGLVTGSFATGFLANIIGRKPCFFVGGTFTLVSFTLKAVFEENWTVLHVSRLLFGFGTGIICVASLVYVGEIASTKNRGKFLTGLDVFRLIGIILVTSIGTILPYYVVSCIGIFLCVCFMIGVFFIPESPLFLMMKGDEASITKSLTALGRIDDIDNAFTVKLEQLAVIKRKRDYWIDIFKVKGNRRGFFLTMVLIILQQAIGVMAMTYIVQTVVVFTLMPISFTYISIIIAGTQVFAGSIAPFLVEFFGRKTMLTISTASCGLCLAFVGTLNFVHFFVKPTIWTGLFLLLIFVNLFMSYELGFGKIPQTLVGEMFTPYSRSAGASLILSINFLVTYLFTFSMGHLSELNSNIPFWIYSITCACACAVTIFLVPETMGKSLNEIQEMMTKNKLLHANKP